jgi:Ni,Fe-hydrogenase III large subunit
MRIALHSGEKLGGVRRDIFFEGLEPEISMPRSFRESAFISRTKSSLTKMDPSKRKSGRGRVDRLDAMHFQNDGEQVRGDGHRAGVG